MAEASTNLFRLQWEANDFTPEWPSEDVESRIDVWCFGLPNEDHAKLIRTWGSVGKKWNYFGRWANCTSLTIVSRRL